MGTGKREGIGTGMMKRLSGSRRIEAVWTAGLLVLPMLLLLLLLLPMMMMVWC